MEAALVEIQLYRGGKKKEKVTFPGTDWKLEIPTAKRPRLLWVNLSHGSLSGTCLDPGNPSLKERQPLGISIAQSKGCNYNLSNGIISPSFSTHSVFA